MGLDQELMTPCRIYGYSVVSFGVVGFDQEIDATLSVSGLFRSRAVAGFDQETDDTLPNLGLFGVVRLRVRTGVAYRGVK